MTTTSVVRTSGLVVHLLDGPYVTRDGAYVDLPDGTRTLVVLLARRGTQVDRGRAAHELWPDCGSGRAHGNLRSALWRLNRCAPGLVDACRRTLRLGRDVAVDVADVVAWSQRVADGSAGVDEVLDRVPHVVRPTVELLPGWDDDSVLLDRAWLRQQVLHAFERAAARWLDDEPAAAAQVAAALVHAEPLRESAQRLLLEALLAEGNRVEAHRALDEHRRLLRRELGVDVSPELDALVRAGARAGARAVAAP
ncbi:AfsR/SARP family transcriptional regulator [Cellulomonas palmilytica]|uniref:AfsR/SARP family transcriptional regulator n=1 Tax=Cellulomonas palmilytica TaxID=2608402 RepID=UPI001F371113|nr:BTAD domain-containing putative transcriptional regulator [Cellulomonas palmilytica]UJP40451.1 SARP family transcriptional regulator [Cellulomonas palmilytica]